MLGRTIPTIAKGQIIRRAQIANTRTITKTVTYIIDIKTKDTKISWKMAARTEPPGSLKDLTKASVIFCKFKPFAKDMDKADMGFKRIADNWFAKVTRYSPITKLKLIRRATIIKPKSIFLQLYFSISKMVPKAIIIRNKIKNIFTKFTINCQLILICSGIATAWVIKLSKIAITIAKIWDMMLIKIPKIPVIIALGPPVIKDHKEGIGVAVLSVTLLWAGGINRAEAELIPQRKEIKMTTITRVLANTNRFFFNSFSTFVL
jgi:hypothetical protein